MEPPWRSESPWTSPMPHPRSSGRLRHCASRDDLGRHQYRWTRHAAGGQHAHRPAPSAPAPDRRSPSRWHSRAGQATLRVPVIPSAPSRGQKKGLAMAIGILAAVLGLLFGTAAIIIPRLVNRHNNPRITRTRWPTWRTPAGQRRKSSRATELRPAGPRCRVSARQAARTPAKRASPHLSDDGPELRWPSCPRPRRDVGEIVPPHRREPCGSPSSARCWRGPRPALPSRDGDIGECLSAGQVISRLRGR